MANRQRGAAPQVNAAFPHRPASPRSPGTAVRSGARAAQRKAKRGWDGTRMGDRREEVDGAAISPPVCYSELSKQLHPTTPRRRRREKWEALPQPR